MGTMLDESVVRNEYNALCARIGEDRAYRTLAMKFHTDTGDQPNAIAFQHLEKICEKFKDNKKRTKELEGQAMERQAKEKEMDELAAKKQCSLTNLEKRKAAGEKERQKRQRAHDRKTARMNAETGGAITPTIAPPTSIETLTEPCSPATEKEVSAPATGAAEQEDVATILDTSLPPNTAALDIFNGIVCDLNNGTLKVPMNGHREYAHGTFLRNVAPIRSLLENKFNDVPVSSSETDLEHILDNVATRTAIPKTDDAQLNKLPTAAKWFLKVLRSNVGDDSPVALCDTTVSPPVEETIESDATPMSLEEEVSLLPDGAPPPNPTVESSFPTTTTSSKKKRTFFDAMWERVLPDIIPECRPSINDYVLAAKRCTSGKESNFPLVNTVDELLTVCDNLMKKSDGCIEAKQHKRIKKVIIAVTARVERVGFDAARDYFLQNGAETAHPVSCA